MSASFLCCQYNSWDAFHGTSEGNNMDWHQLPTMTMIMCTWSSAVIQVGVKLVIRRKDFSVMKTRCHICFLSISLCVFHPPNPPPHHTHTHTHTPTGTHTQYTYIIHMHIHTHTHMMSMECRCFLQVISYRLSCAFGERAANDTANLFSWLCTWVEQRLP